MTFSKSKREIRVFISSTFKDMSVEREYIINKVFPSLRRDAEEHHVRLIPIDLRWGITDEETSTGRTASICLEQIDQSRPFFIGLVGHRYGWCPRHSDVAAAQQRYPRVAAYVDHGMSMTEIEMQYAVLDNTSHTEALFLFKNDIQGKTPDEGIVKLRHKIMEGHAKDVHWYSELEEIGASIRREIMRLLEEYFPKASATSVQMAVEALKEEAQRMDNTYVEPKQKYTEGDEDITVHIGERGSGKSASAAHLAIALQRVDHQWPIYLRCDSDLTNHSRDMCLQIVRQQLIDALPERDQAKWGDANMQQLAVAAADLAKGRGKRLRLIIDSIEMVDDWENPDIHTELLLPFLSTQNAKIDVYIDSLWANRPLREILEYPFRDVLGTYRTLPEADAEVRKDYIIRYLDTYGKKLTPVLVDRLANNHVSMKLLTFTLEEIVNYGTFETLPDYLEELTKVATYEDLYTHVIRKAQKLLDTEDATRLLAVLAIVVEIGVPEDVLRRDVLKWLPVRWAEAEGVLRSVMRRQKSGISAVSSFFSDMALKAVGYHSAEAEAANIAEALKGVATHKFERACMLYIQEGRRDELYALLVQEGAIADFIQEHHTEQTIYMIKDLLITNPVKYSLMPLVQLLADMAKDGSGAKKLAVDAARALIDLNLHNFRNLEFCKALFRNFADLMDISDFTIFQKTYLRPFGYERQVKILEQTSKSEPFCYALLIEKLMTYNQSVTAAKVADGAIAALQKLGEDYALDHPHELIDIRLAVAYVWLYFRRDNRAFAELEAAEQLAQKVPQYTELPLKIGIYRGLINFLVAYKMNPKDFDTLKDVAEKLIGVCGRAEMRLGGRDPITWEAYRILVSLLLMVDEWPDGWQDAAVKIWQDAESITRPDNWRAHMVLPRGIPQWIDHALEGNHEQFCTNMVKFYLKKPIQEWLAPALLWNQRIARLKKCKPEETSFGAQLYEERTTALSLYEEQIAYRSMACLLWPNLLESHEDNVYEEAIEAHGGFEESKLSQVWRDLVGMRKNWEEVVYTGLNSNLRQWFEVLGGDALREVIYTTILNIYECAKSVKSVKHLLASVPVIDDEAIINAAETDGVPSNLALLLCDIVECQYELEGLSIEMQRIEAGRRCNV